MANDPKISSRASCENISRVIDPGARLFASNGPRTTSESFTVIASASILPATVSFVFDGLKNSLSLRLNLPVLSK